MYKDWAIRTFYQFQSSTWLVVKYCSGWLHAGTIFWPFLLAYFRAQLTWTSHIMMWIRCAFCLTIQSSGIAGEAGLNTCFKIVWSSLWFTVLVTQKPFNVPIDKLLKKLGLEEGVQDQFKKCHDFGLFCPKRRVKTQTSAPASDLLVLTRYKWENHSLLQETTQGSLESWNKIMTKNVLLTYQSANKKWKIIHTQNSWNQCGKFSPGRWGLKEAW